ncbi:MAG: ABC transporter ATP-binding protein, partial [Lentisphaeria bacterium]|nr:ABC transporter ATP-binding protein [Lentisphaeria bacterium]
ILDEATSSIDTRTELRIQEAMLDLTNGRTSFIIAHRLSTIRNSDVIVVMQNGNIAQQGTHDELVNVPGVYQTLYEKQRKIAKNM